MTLEKGGELEIKISPNIHTAVVRSQTPIIHTPLMYVHAGVHKQAASPLRLRLRLSEAVRRANVQTYLERNRCSNSGPARSASWRLFLSFFSRFLADTSTWCAYIRQTKPREKLSDAAKTLTWKGRYVGRPSSGRHYNIPVMVRTSKDERVPPDVYSPEALLLQDSAVLAITSVGREQAHRCIYSKGQEKKQT